MEFSRKPAETTHPIRSSLPDKNGWHFPDAMFFRLTGKKFSPEARRAVKK
jgi:hypothetical protein